MTRPWPAAMALALAATVLPVAARAQTTPAAGAITVRLVKIDGETVNSNSPRPVNADDCTEPTAIIQFDLQNVPTSKTTIDVYIGTDCQMKNRDTEDASCTFVEAFEIGGRMDLEIDLDAGLTGCDDGKPNLWFLAVNTSKGGEEVGTSYGVLAVEFDATAPAAPTDVEGGAGEREIPVSWETMEGEAEEFIVYIDDQATRGSDGADDGGVSGDGECSSSRLIAGTAADEISRSVRKKSIEEGSATGIDLSASDIGGDFAAVGVVVVDHAGNASVLSEIACVEVVETEGFWERYEANGGEAVEGCECRAQPGRARDGVGGILVAAACLLALARRRRSAR